MGGPRSVRSRGQSAAAAFGSHDVGPQLQRLRSADEPPESTGWRLIMAQVVAGIACSHVPFMASPGNWERLDPTERTNLHQGFDRARLILESSRADVLITFADD